MHDRNRPSSATMRCLDCGYALDGVWTHQCPECGRPFDPDDGDTFQQSLEEPKRLCIARSVTDAYALSTILEGSGIPTAVEYNAAGIVEPAKGSVWVNSWDLERAQAVLRERRSPPEGADQWVVQLAARP